MYVYMFFTNVYCMTVLDLIKCRVTTY